MSSLTRRMQLRNVRPASDALTARRLRGQLRGSKLGTVNPRAPKPNSGKARGSRRGTHKNPMRLNIGVPA